MIPTPTIKVSGRTGCLPPQFGKDLGHSDKRVPRNMEVIKGVVAKFVRTGDLWRGANSFKLPVGVHDRSMIEKIHVHEVEQRLSPNIEHRLSRDSGVDQDGAVV
jgi:hypothetical protein